MQPLTLAQMAAFTAELFDRAEEGRKAAALLKGILDARSLRLSEIAQAMPGNPQANYKAIHRFLQASDPREVVRRLYQADAPFVLVDPTEVERPQATHTEYVGTLADDKTAGFWLLVLAVPYRGRALPFHCITYSSRTIGAEATSRNWEHRRALRAVKGLRGEQPLVMDREFSYEGLLRDLRAEGLHFVIRLNVESGVHLVEEGGRQVGLDVPPGQRRVLRGVWYRGVVPVNLVGEWKVGMEKPLWVMTDLAPEAALEIYGARMKIEESFRDLKGLLGLGKLMNKQRVYMEKMVALLLMVYAIGLLVGEALRDRVYGGGGKMAAIFGSLCAAEAEAGAAAGGSPLPRAHGLAVL